MDRDQFEMFLRELMRQINANRFELDNAVKKEFSKGGVFKVQRIEKIIKSYENSMDFKSENKKIAVAYPGRPEVTISYMLDAICHNNHVTLCTSDVQEINAILFRIFKESLLLCKMKNTWIEYDNRYNELFVRDNEKTFDKIVYVGDYFEYLIFKKLFKGPIEFNNYGYIKVYMDKSKFKDEYDRIFKFSRSENVSIEFYTDADDFINESKEEDYSVIFGDLQEINKIRKAIRAGSILINAFPYGDYMFRINR